jgi:predicted nucleic acid-binding protein
MVVSHRPWLIDKSALVRLGRSPDADEWAARIERGLVHITTVTLLEAGYSARSATDLAELLDRPPLARMPMQYMTPASENRAVEVLRALTNRGHHRAPSIPDLLIAATAEQAKLIVLHADKDFELIADVTGQAIERIRFDSP